MSRQPALGGQRMGKRARAAEAAIATAAAFDDNKLPTLAQLEGTLRSVRRGLDADSTDPTNPRSSAAAKLRIIERTEGKIARREYKGARRGD